MSENDDSPADVNEDINENKNKFVEEEDKGVESNGNKGDNEGSDEDNKPKKKARKPRKPLSKSKKARQLEALKKGREIAKLNRAKRKKAKEIKKKEEEEEIDNTILEYAKKTKGKLSNEEKLIKRIEDLEKKLEQSLSVKKQENIEMKIEEVKEKLDKEQSSNTVSHKVKEDKDNIKEVVKDIKPPPQTVQERITPKKNMYDYGLKSIWS